MLQALVENAAVEHAAFTKAPLMGHIGENPMFEIPQTIDEVESEGKFDIAEFKREMKK